MGIDLQLLHSLNCVKMSTKKSYLDRGLNYTNFRNWSLHTGLNGPIRPDLNHAYTEVWIKSGFRIQTTVFYIFNMSVPWITSHFFQGHSHSLLFLSMKGVGRDGKIRVETPVETWNCESYFCIFGYADSAQSLRARALCTMATSALKASTKPIFYSYLLYFVSASIWMCVAFSHKFDDSIFE